MGPSVVIILALLSGCLTGDKTAVAPLETSEQQKQTSKPESEKQETIETDNDIEQPKTLNPIEDKHQDNSDSGVSRHTIPATELTPKIIIKDFSQLGIDISGKIGKELLFLKEQFGPPVANLDSLTITVKNQDSSSHATSFINTADRRLLIDPFNFADGAEHIIVHELFHLFYQPINIVEIDVALAEAWASYAERLRKDQELDNQSDRYEYIKNGMVDEKYCVVSELKNIRWVKLIEEDPRTSYNNSLCPLISIPHEITLRLFQDYSSLVRKVKHPWQILSHYCAVSAESYWTTEMRNIATLQSCLNLMGYKAVAVDGILGPITSQAIQNYSLNFIGRTIGSTQKIKKRKAVRNIYDAFPAVRFYFDTLSVNVEAHNQPTTYLFTSKDLDFVFQHFLISASVLSTELVNEY